LLDPVIGHIRKDIAAARKYGFNRTIKTRAFIGTYLEHSASLWTADETRGIAWSSIRYNKPQMKASQPPALAIEHVESSTPAAFTLTRLEDGKSLPPVAVGSSYASPVEGRPNSLLMRELRWYMEQFLDST
jgi:hypothetical protein